MPTSIDDADVLATIAQARAGQGRGTLFASPEDWRDQWIYFLMLDRFNNPTKVPQNAPFDAPFTSYQGGTFNGVRAQLQYLKELGVGAIWLSPPLKNPRYSDSYHGYGIQNFLAAEPHFASSPEKADSELRSLVDEAHKAGIYVIFDIVLHHSGDVFEYAEKGAATGSRTAGWSNKVLGVRWRDENGHGDPALTQAPSHPALDAAVFPDELRLNSRFTRRGETDPSGAVHPFGDFFSLKGLATDLIENGIAEVQNVLIRCYQYVIAKFDCDAFRIDTLKFLSPDFERTFGNAMREFALSAGKKNFFTFGEVFADENTIAQFVGRNTSLPDGLVGVDAALDFPLFFKLPSVLKGLNDGTPLDIANVFEARKQVEKDIITSHGEAGKYFVSFLDSHDQAVRFGFTGPAQLVDQIVLGIGCLFALQGIPCLYYGTEQGLSGHKHDTLTDDSMVREALWGRTDRSGKPNGFDQTNPIYLAVQKIARVRSEQPALRYGRQYFRPITGTGSSEFAISTFPAGVVAFSRILNDQEVVVVANTNSAQAFHGEVIIDRQLNPTGTNYGVLFSNKAGSGGSKVPGAVVDKPAGTVTIHEINQSVTKGPARALPVDLVGGELQILGR